MFKGKKIIVFDLDGTIVRLKAKWHALKDVLSTRYAEKNGKACSFDSISACLSKIVENNDEQELMENFKIIRKYELEHIKDTELVPEIVYFIKNSDKFKLQENPKFAVFSLNTKETIFESLELAGVKKYIELIIGREDVRKWKPDPEGLLKIMNYFSCSPNEMVFFGDMKKDLNAGKAAGIDSYYITELIKYVKKFQKINSK